MEDSEKNPTEDFLKSLGFPAVETHRTFSHFDFSKPGRRVLVIGPMGSGKTEFASRIWHDAEVARRKSGKVGSLTSTGAADRRRVFFIRNDLDSQRFLGCPPDAMPYRNGYIKTGGNIARIKDSFGLERVLEDNPDVGTFIIDEASFFDERMAYVVRKHSLERGVMFVFPTLILNFRKAIFNSTARLILDTATDVIPLTAYCDHRDCLGDAFYTYRYYDVDGTECPALYFDPLIVVGGDRAKSGSWAPNYCARCDKHHWLPGKEYTFLTLKPMAEAAARGDSGPLLEELGRLKDDKASSLLRRSIEKEAAASPGAEVCLDALRPDFIAEKALCYLVSEQNLLSEEALARFASKLDLNIEYLSKVLRDNGREVDFGQRFLW